MAITFPLTPPTTPGMVRVDLHMRTQVAFARSVFTGKTQVHVHPAQMWIIDVTLPFMTRETAEPWNSFLLSLNGPYGTFLMGDPAGKTPRGNPIGAPVMNGANQTGQTIAVRGFHPNVTGILKSGDYIQIQNRLHKVLADANTDGSGATVLEIVPKLRALYADGQTIITRDCVGTFRLATNDIDICSIGNDKNYTLGFTGVEDLNLPYS